MTLFDPEYDGYRCKRCGASDIDDSHECPPRVAVDSTVATIPLAKTVSADAAEQLAKHGVWTGETVPSPEVLAEAMRFTRCNWCDGEFPLEQHVNGACPKGATLGNPLADEWNRLHAENAALKAKLADVVAQLTSAIEKCGEP